MSAYLLDTKHVGLAVDRALVVRQRIVEARLAKNRENPGHGELFLKTIHHVPDSSVAERQRSAAGSRGLDVMTRSAVIRVAGLLQHVVSP